MLMLLTPRQLSPRAGLLRFLCMLLFFCPTQVLAQTQNLTELDWVPREQLTAEQAANCPNSCAGAYIEPTRDDEYANTDPRDAPIQGEANNGEIRTDTSMAKLEGNVRFTQGNRELQAQVVEIDRERGYLSLEGEVLIREPGILMLGESAEIEAETDEVRLEGAQYLLHEQRIRGAAERITRSPDTGISIDNATYTACEPGDNAWVLIADNLDINEQTGVATARNVSMETSGIPFFYAPYFQFIIDDRRATGLLYPDIGYSNDEGFQYDQPIYINLAENRDLTLTPRFTGKRGSGLEAEYRFLTANSYNELAGVFFPDDDINPNHPDNRWAGVIDHRGYFGNINTRINLEAVSDDDFLNDWGTNIFFRDRRDVFLKQDARISTQLKNWELSASTTAYQNLIDDQQKEYQELPRLNANGHYRIGNFSLELLNEWASFELSDINPATPGSDYSISTDGQPAEGSRLSNKWSASWNETTAWGYLKPKIGINYIAYDLDSALLGRLDAKPDIFAAEASLDTGLIFERDMSFFGTNNLQTLEPRLYYLYRDAGDQSEMPIFDTAFATQSLEQLFRDSEFVGGDRLEDANRTTLGIWSRFFSADTQREFLSFGIGQTFYFTDRTTQLVYPQIFGTSQVVDPVPVPPFIVSESILATPAIPSDPLELINEPTRNRSDTIAEAKWTISSEWSLEGNLFWDDVNSDLDQSRLELAYKPLQDGNFLKLSYLQQDNYTRFSPGDTPFSINAINEDIEQVTVSGQWSLDEQWRFAFLIQEDFENDRNLDRILGVTYESCCWNISLSWQDALTRSVNDGLITSNPRRDKSIVLSFEFLGLGGVGKSGSRLIGER